MTSPAPVSDELALDTLATYTIRLLSADIVHNANSGHLGTPFGSAPLANALWGGKIMRFAPSVRWMNRDRFVLSCGHASALLYSMLHLTGQGVGGPYEVTIDALKQFRKAGSRTPGHPEFRMTSGVEVTTGPLGQGFANGVGMAIAQAHLASRFNREGFPLFDNYVFVLAGDGCLMEGITNEAASLAGHLKLHKLIVFYDDNKVTIDGKTDLTFSEDVAGGYTAKGWNVLHISDGDHLDSSVYEKAVQEAKSQTEKPTIVIMKTTIGCGAGKGIEGEAKAHGGKFSTLDAIRQKWFSPAGLRKLGGAVEEKVATMVQGELDQIARDPCADGPKPTVLPTFYVPRPVLKKFRDAGAKGDAMAEEWTKMVEQYCQKFADVEPDLVEDLKARLDGKCVSEKWEEALQALISKEKAQIDKHLRDLSNVVEEDELEPRIKRRKSFDDGFKYKAGRVYAAEVLKCFVQNNPAVIGGSPDVASSCGAHFPAIQGHFLPPSFSEKYEGASYAGRYIHFGVREHACLGILNGISAYDGLIPYSSLFTVFYQYGLPAVRMASISKFPVLYIGTHDSIDLGEDGPTHQPVEVLPQLRAMPNLLVIRPANVAETAGAFQVLAEQYQAPRQIDQYVDPVPLKRRPVFIMTSRGELGLPYRSNTPLEGQEGVKKGAYVIHDCYDRPQGSVGKPSLACLPDIVLIGSGQDVALVMRTKELLLQWSRDFNARLKPAFAPYPQAMGLLTEIVKVRIVSMPCWELFDEQDQDYQDSVLLSNYRDILRIYVEKAATKNTGHDKYSHISVLMPSYGLSGKAAEVEEKLEFTAEHVAVKVWAAWIQRGRHLTTGGDRADTGLETWVSRLGRRAGCH